jgi:hypothetical protein
MNRRKTSKKATIMADRPAGTLGVTSTNARGFGARAAEATTSSRLRTAAETCAVQVGYWAGEVIKPGYQEYGDYQKMGLTAANYQLVLDIAKEAKQLRKTATAEQTLAFITREATRRCAAAAATTCTTTSQYGYPPC